MTQRRLKTLLGDYPGTLALKKGQIQSDLVAFDFADVKVPSSAFKRVVRDIEFDVGELAVFTYIIARAFDKPIELLPAVMVKSCRVTIRGSAAIPLVKAPRSW